MSSKAPFYNDVKLVNIQFTEQQIDELLGTIKTKQMRIQNRIQNGTDHDRDRALRKLYMCRQLQEKLEQGALTF